MCPRPPMSRRWRRSVPGCPPGTAWSSFPWTTRWIVGPGYVKVSYARALVKKAPALGVDDVLPAEEEGAIFQYYGKAYQAGAGERRLARR